MQSNEMPYETVIRKVFEELRISIKLYNNDIKLDFERII